MIKDGIVLAQISTLNKKIEPEIKESTEKLPVGVFNNKVNNVIKKQVS